MGSKVDNVGAMQTWLGRPWLPEHRENMTDWVMAVVRFGQCAGGCHGCVCVSVARQGMAARCVCRMVLK